MTAGASSGRDLSGCRAVLFDLDGVLTPTGVLHRRAWHELFDDVLAAWPGTAPYTEADYFTHVDGRPREDGVRAVLRNRGIDLPEGSAGDGALARTVNGLARRKNDIFVQLLAEDGIQGYPGSVALVHHLAARDIPMAVVSSSANAVDVLASTDLLRAFRAVVDGPTALARRLPGKPAPDTFLHAAELLRVHPGVAAVVEDAVAGVEAAAAGRFGTVIGVDRGAGHHALHRAGAHRVVDDLAELVGRTGPGRPAR